MIARRFGLGVLVAVVCALFAVMCFGGGVALAAAPEAPVLQVASRVATPGEEISLFGFLYPGAPGEPGSYEFLYKQSATECQGGSKGPLGVATGSQFEVVSETLTGLQAGVQYTICLAVTSPGGTTLSAPATVTTPIAPEAATGLKAEPVAAFTATLQGTLNPSAERKVEPGSYGFVYQQSPFECEGEGQITTPQVTGAGEQNEAVFVPLSGLLPHTAYTFCLRQTNEVGEVATSAPVTFTTLAAAPKIEEIGATDVTAESATLTANINPQGAETAYVFEYAPAGGAFVPVPEAHGKGALGEGTAGLRVSAHLQGLSTHSTYEFRVMVANSVETVTSAPVSFMTQTTGTPFALPDGRQWEMVSPPQKEGSQFKGKEGGQAAADGNAFMDLTLFEPIEDGAEGAYGFFDTNVFGRGGGGWVSRTIIPPHSETGPISLNGPEYKFFSEDLSEGVLQPQGPLTPLAPGVTQATPYIHTDYLNGDPGELCSTGCYRPLVSEANVPAGTEYGGEQNGPCANVFCGPETIAATPDLGHVLLSSSVGLTAGSSEGIYEWSSSGKLSFVGVGGVGSKGEEGGLSLHRNVISDDGSRVFINGSYEGLEGLLMRDMVTGETVRLDVPQGNGLAPVPPGQAEFEAANSDGSRVFFIGEQPLVEGAGARSLYEYYLNAAAGSRLSDLSVGGKAGEAAGVMRMLGASEDGSYVYFAASGALAPGASPAECNTEGQACVSQCVAQTRACMNLYVRHDDTTSFITGLGAEDYPDWQNRNTGFSARVSPDGRWLAFMSDRDLTGYDTTDAVSGRPDEEVYLYDASAGKLVCASCDPTGARPVGVETGSGGAGFLDNHGEFGRRTWVAADVPAWRSYGLAEMGAYQPRYLSDTGRLFFDSTDALVAQDVNGVQDVYEYEPGGAGNCEASGVAFSEASDGCVSLVSSGESSEASGFLDASETGGDVFFLTTSRLLSQDFDNAYDIYDARECGPDSSRCFASAPVSPPPCNTGDACKPAPTPQPSIFGNPSSATFAGAGNITQAKPAAVKAKTLTRAQRLARALDACHRRKGKRRRACEHKAKARYGARKPDKTHANKRSGR